MRGPLSAAAVVAIAVACVYLVPRGGQRDGEDAALPLLPSPLDAADAAAAPKRLATALTFVSMSAGSCWLVGGERMKSRLYWDIALEAS